MSIPSRLTPLLAQYDFALERLTGDEADDWDDGHTQLRLLPQYDGYVLGSYPRDEIVPSLAKTRVVSSKERRMCRCF